MEEKTQRAPLEPVADEYTILLSDIDTQKTKAPLDIVKTVINGEEVLIKIPDIA